MTATDDYGECHCGAQIKPRHPDPWDGRLDGYCYDCALARCDAYPGECPNAPLRLSAGLFTDALLRLPADEMSTRCPGRTKRSILVDALTATADLLQSSRRFERPSK